MVCLIVAQFVYLMVGSAFFMTLERDNAQQNYQSVLGRSWTGLDEIVICSGCDRDNLKIIEISFDFALMPFNTIIFV